jgi:hypothetical protein
MKTLLITAKAMPGAKPGVTTYRIPLQHPMKADKEGNLAPVGQVPGLTLQLGEETEVQVADERHEQLLRDDPHLVLSEPKAARVAEPKAAKGK